MKHLNIKRTGFTSVNEETKEARILMSIKESGDITLSPFSIKQLTAGAHEFLQLQTESTKHRGISVDYFALLIKLSQHVSETALHAGEITGLLTFQVNRDDVLALKMWLELRMAHCEKERDERIGLNNEPLPAKVYTESDIIDASDNCAAIQDDRLKFNADSYITMKLLLIELKEWLLGVAVPDYTEAKQMHNKM